MESNYSKDCKTSKVVQLFKGLIWWFWEITSKFGDLVIDSSNLNAQNTFYIFIQLHISLGASLSVFSVSSIFVVASLLVPSISLIVISMISRWLFYNSYLFVIFIFLKDYLRDVSSNMSRPALNFVPHDQPTSSNSLCAAIWSMWSMVIV